MFRSRKGDAAFEWILVATVGTLVFGAIVYNLSQTTGGLANTVEDGIGAFSGAAPDAGAIWPFTPTPDPRGIIWTAQSASAAGSWDVAYGNPGGVDTYVAVGYSNLILYSTNGGVTWSEASLPTTIESWGVAYGAGQFVAVAGYVQDANTTQTVFTSPDGINWTRRTATNREWRDVAYGDGKFVAVDGSFGSGRVIVSSDGGATWTQSQVGTAGYHTIEYGNGKFVALGSSKFMTSTDGVSWTEYAAPFADGVWYGLAYGGGQFAAVSWDGACRIATSPDATSGSWTCRDNGTQEWASVTYGNGMFAVGSYKGRISTSYDGITWTTRYDSPNPGAPSAWMGLTYGGNRFVGISDRNAIRAITSP